MSEKQGIDIAVEIVQYDATTGLASVKDGNGRYVFDCGRQGRERLGKFVSKIQDGIVSALSSPLPSRETGAGEAQRLDAEIQDCWTRWEGKRRTLGHSFTERERATAICFATYHATATAHATAHSAGAAERGEAMKKLVDASVHISLFHLPHAVGHCDCTCCGNFRAALSAARKVIEGGGT